MRVAIIGAGIIGVTTAYELAAEGHEVTVYERRSTVAAETSFANAGLVAPGYVTPWAAPGMPLKVLRQLASRHAAVRLHPGLDLAWGWRWWRACRASTHQANRLRLQRLAIFSRARLDELTARLRLDYERRHGYLVLLRSPKDFAMVEPGLATLSALGTRFALLDAAQCRRIEPGLATSTPLHAGIHLPDEVVGNCRQFAMLLRKECAQLGVRYQFETQVIRLEADRQPRVVATRAPRRVESAALPDDAETTDGDSARTSPDWADTQPLGSEPSQEIFDAVVVCAALGGKGLLRPLGVHVPMQAVHGYSLTAPLRHDDAEGTYGPRAALMDERYKVAISRLGSRIRVAGSAELGGAADRHDPRALATLYQVLDDWFPGAARLKDVQHWKGARPMLPDGPPVLGASGAAGIWLNLGHGSSGWALACGSARVLTDALGGRPAPIDVEGLGIERLRG